jgi:CRP-like cAMP-binding protein
MFTSHPRTATARAASDCILFLMSNADFEDVVRDYPTCATRWNDRTASCVAPCTCRGRRHRYFDAILAKAMERLEMIVRSNASAEVRMHQLPRVRVASS